MTLKKGDTFTIAGIPRKKGKVNWKPKVFKVVAVVTGMKTVEDPGSLTMPGTFIKVQQDDWSG